MAIQFVGGVTDSKAGGTGNTSAINLDELTGGTDTVAAAGDLVIGVYATGSTTDRTLSITDAVGGNDYTLIGSELYANDNFDTNLRVGYKFMPDPPDLTTAFGATGNAADAGTMAVYVFRGVDPTTPLDGVSVVTGTQTNTGLPDPDAITPATAGAFIVIVGAAAHNRGTVAFSSPSDLVSFITVGSNDTNDSTLGIGHKADWTSGAFNPEAWTGITDSVDFSAAWICFVLRPAPALVFPVTSLDLGAGFRRRPPLMIAN
jgi:hypothetical protein